MVQPLLSLKESDTHHRQTKRFQKKQLLDIRIFILENFSLLSKFYIIDLQIFKNIFGKLSAKQEVAKENIW